MVSAMKVDGRRLHELARQGVEIERAPRRCASTVRHRRGVDGPRRSARAAGRGRCRPAPTSARSPPTSDICSAPAPTSATCADRRRAVHDRRGRTARRVRAASADRGRRALPKVAVDERASGRSPSASRSPLRPATGRGRWSPSRQLLAVYEPFAGGLANRPSCSRSNRLTRAARDRGGIWANLRPRRPVRQQIRPPDSVGRRAGDHRARPGTVAGRTHRRHDRRLRRCPSRTPGGHRPGAHDRRRVRRSLGGADVRPSPGDGRPPGVGTPAAHRPEQRLELLAATGIDATVVLPFDEDQSHESPESFVHRVLVHGLRVRGRRRRGLPLRCHRRGHVDLLEKLGRATTS